MVGEDGKSVQVDKFESGDVDDFRDHFEICALANGWSVEKKALMMVTCLNGEALEVYKSLKLRVSMRTIGKCIRQSSLLMSTIM